ncbi:MAG: four helix bundle protein [Candidatus Doudnabacteria bacterium]|nr:four helix bundle protein [Candidatus Doudnabacteria bacterium]
MENKTQNEYFKKLKEKMDTYVHFIYKLIKNFPKDELYGCASQLRRATLSIILNFIESFARRKTAVKRNFLGNILWFVAGIQIFGKILFYKKIHK